MPAAFNPFPFEHQKEKLWSPVSPCQKLKNNVCFHAVSYYQIFHNQSRHCNEGNKQIAIYIIKAVCRAKIVQGRATPTQRAFRNFFLFPENHNSQLVFDHKKKSVQLSVISKARLQGSRCSSYAYVSERVHSCAAFNT